MLEKETARTHRHGPPLCVVLLDLDHFKKINDTWGHPMGDRVLKETANLLSHTIRQCDAVGRYGGEEFMVILPMTNLEEALIVANKLLLAVANSPIDPVGNVSVSIGVQEVDPSDVTKDDAVERSDQQLYYAKHAGRNRVEPSQACTKTSLDLI